MNNSKTSLIISGLFEEEEKKKQKTLSGMTVVPMGSYRGTCNDGQYRYQQNILDLWIT